MTYRFQSTSGFSERVVPSAELTKAPADFSSNEPGEQIDRPSTKFSTC